MQKGGMSASVWQDRKQVICMSSNSQPNGEGTVPSRQLNGTRTQVQCPASIMSYNKYMGGVDVGDQLRGYYKCRSKSRKFYISTCLFSYSMWPSQMHIFYVSTTNQQQPVKLLRISGSPWRMN